MCRAVFFFMRKKGFVNCQFKFDVKQFGRSKHQKEFTEIINIDKPY